MSVADAFGVSTAELVARQQEAMLDNFYSGFTNGPYSYGFYPEARFKRANPIYHHTHCVFDGNGKPVITGTDKECQQFVERFNLSYAKHIMLKDIKPKDADHDR
jgi:hypothetical protein